MTLNEMPEPTSASSPDPTRQVARAKLTRSLRIVGRRPDGYHLIDSEMVTLDLADTLTFSPGDGLEVIDLVRSRSQGAASVPSGAGNLVNKALAMLGRQSWVRLDKRIPTGAGLGGGSADAAAVLRWGGCSDLAVAASIGADVPFCLDGGRAHVSGIGEVVEPMEFEERYFVLLTPALQVSTPAVYAAWDSMGRPSARNENDLEAPALRVEPELATWRDRLGELTGLDPVLAGSGSTWFVEVGGPHRWPGPDAAEHLAWRGALLIQARTER